MIASVAIATLLAAALPSPVTGSAAASSNITWNGITIGAPSASLRTTLGDPLRVTAGKIVRVARYWLPGSQSSYFLVVEEGGRVAGFVGFSEPDGTVEGLPPDPSGVRVGDSLDSLKAKHPDFHTSQDSENDPTFEGESAGARVSYRIANGRVADFQWNYPLDASLPALPPIADPSGASFATAILDAQKGEADGTAWEYRYVAFHPCAAGEHWKMQQQSLLRHDGRAYDRLHVICPSSKTERDFYFDITPYFGKY